MTAEEREDVRAFLHEELRPLREKVDRIDRNQSIAKWLMPLLFSAVITVSGLPDQQRGELLKTLVSMVKVAE